MLRAMRFTLVDRVIERTPDRVVAIKCVTLAEEYLQDHFPGFPVLPGVLMLEAMVEAARAIAVDEVDASGRPLVLGRVRGLKYGRFVTPGSTVRIEVDRRPDGSYSGRVLLVGQNGEADGIAASGRFELRPVSVLGERRRASVEAATARPSEVQESGVGGG